MSTEFSFAPPGENQSDWSYLPPRSECCQSDPVVVRAKILSISFSYATAGGRTADDIARMAKFDSIDPETLGVGFWTLAYNTGTAEWEPVATGTGSIVHFVEDNGSGVTFERHGKASVRFGWTDSASGVAWRTMDGSTVRVEVQKGVQPLDADGDADGAPTMTDISQDLSIADTDTEKFTDAIAFPEPGTRAVHYWVTGFAFAPRECL